MDKMPEVERIIIVPYAGDTVMTQQVVNNEIDSASTCAPTPSPTIEKNPQLITHTRREPPYGYMDWWPTSMWFNHEDGPFTDQGNALGRQLLASTASRCWMSRCRAPVSSRELALPEVCTYGEVLRGRNRCSRSTRPMSTTWRRPLRCSKARAMRRTATASGPRTANASGQHRRLAGLHRHRPNHRRAVAQVRLRG